MIKTSNLNKFYHGWFIGNFENSLLKTEDFEVAVIHHPKGQKWERHYHKIATEYNVLISGRMELLEDSGYSTSIGPGMTFVIEPNTTVEPIFFEDCVVVTVKVPSVPGDKYVEDR